MNLENHSFLLNNHKHLTGLYNLGLGNPTQADPDFNLSQLREELFSIIQRFVLNGISCSLYLISSTG